MTYRKRYEDSYLDEEDEEFEGDDRTDAERIVGLLEKPNRTPKDERIISKLTERLFVGGRLPGPPGEQALYGLEVVAQAYADLGRSDASVGLWGRIADLAGAIGNKELYYKAMDGVSGI